MGWALWQRQQKERISLGFWSGRGQKPDILQQSNSSEYTGLLQVEPLKKEGHIIVRTSLLIKRWVENMCHSPTSATVQFPCWLSSMPICRRQEPCPLLTLSLEMWVLLGPRECVNPPNARTPFLVTATVERDCGKFPLMSGIKIGLVGAIHSPRLQPNTGTVLTETGTSHSSPWAELRAV